MDTFSAFVPLNKVEEQPDGSLVVFGRATQEIPDYAGEIMDYEKSVPHFQQRSKENYDMSGGENLMSLRSMHQPIAAGKVTEFIYKPEEKAIDIAAKVVDPAEVKKVKEKVYLGLSIGGKYVKRWQDGNWVRYEADPHEVSLVDRPAVPTARLTLFKVEADQVETKPEWMDEFNKNVALIDEIRKAAADEKSKQEEKLKSIGERVGIARRDGSPLTPPKDYPSDPDEYGDPANYAYPVDESRATVAVGRFNGGEGEEKYSSRERAVLGRRIARLASRFGAKYEYDGKKINRKEEKIMSDENVKKDEEVRKAADPVAVLAQLKAAIEEATSLVTQGGGEAVKVSEPSTPTSTPTPASASAPTEMKMDGASSTTSTPAEKVAAKPTESETKESETKESETKESETTKALAAKVETLSSAVDALVKMMTPKQEPPVNNLAAQVTLKKSGLNDHEQEILDAIESDSPYALQKALRLAGGEDGMNNQMAMQEVQRVIAKANKETFDRDGVLLSQNFAGRVYNAPAN